MDANKSKTLALTFRSIIRVHLRDSRAYFSRIVDFNHLIGHKNFDFFGISGGFRQIVKAPPADEVCADREV